MPPSLGSGCTSHHRAWRRISSSRSVTAIVRVAPGWIHPQGKRSCSCPPARIRNAPTTEQPAPRFGMCASAFSALPDGWKAPCRSSARWRLIISRPTRKWKQRWRFGKTNPPSSPSAKRQYKHWKRAGLRRDRRGGAPMAPLVRAPMERGRPPTQGRPPTRRLRLRLRAEQATPEVIAHRHPERR